MAREKASISIDIWGDSDFRDLTDRAQSLYFKLLSHPKLDYCGVVTFHPGRLAALTREQSADDIMIAAQELSDTFYCVFDQDTDEVMVRSFLRRDGVLLQPRLMVSATKAYAAIGSNKIRAVVVHEVQRFKRENPKLAAWEKPQMKDLLKQESVSVKDTVTELVWSFGGVFGNPYGQGHGQAPDEKSTSPMTGATTSTATSTTPATRSKDLGALQTATYPHPVRGKAVA